jgi:hypothetical protein
MQGANDFVVLDETQAPLNLSAAQYRWRLTGGVGRTRSCQCAPNPLTLHPWTLPTSTPMAGGEH